MVCAKASCVDLRLPQNSKASEKLLILSTTLDQYKVLRWRNYTAPGSEQVAR